ncbi:MAG: class I SAM-dependent methyltransferase [Phycisphaerae bacterium]|nr:class I SAM-dependent methyltransferase [Phycisphaerae bacterium]
MESTLEQKKVSLQWEYICCNICGRDDTAVYHKETVEHFGQELDFQIVRCRHCQLVYTNPRLSEHNATYLYDNSSDEQFQAHGQAKMVVFKPAITEIKNFLNKNPSNENKLLDIGCGSGHFMQLAQNNGFDVTGIEPAETSAHYARNIMNMPVICDDMKNVQLPHESFDAITLWDVIEHVSDPRAVLEQVNKWLKPGGIVALRFPSATWQKIKGIVLQRLLHSKRPSFGPTMHLYFFNEDTFTTIANKAGLEVVKVKSTSNETNANSSLINRIKSVSNYVMASYEKISGKHPGNLEIYCRKPL